MGEKRYTAEQMITKLREAEFELANGRPLGRGVTGYLGRLAEYLMASRIKASASAETSHSV